LRGFSRVAASGRRDVATAVERRAAHTAGFRCVRPVLPVALVLFQASLRDAVGFLVRVPASELAGYCRRSLREREGGPHNAAFVVYGSGGGTSPGLGDGSRSQDRQCAHQLRKSHADDSPRTQVPEGPSDNSPAFQRREGVRENGTACRRHA